VQGWRVLDALPWGMGQTNMAEWKMPCKGALKWDMGKDTKIERTGLTHLKRRAFFFGFLVFQPGFVAFVASVASVVFVGVCGFCGFTMLYLLNLSV